MMDLTLTFLILFLLCSAYLFGLKARTLRCEGIDLDTSTILKGGACIVVVLVHIPFSYSNILQDLAGSFGYIGVSIFMLLSGYGMSYGVTKSNHYFSLSFIKKRFLTLALPFIFSICLKLAFGCNPFWGGTNYILLILFFYAISFISFNLVKSYNIWIWLVICSVFSYSLAGCYQKALIWNVESVFFIVGILIQRFNKVIYSQLNSKNLSIFIISLVLSILLGLLYIHYKYIIFYGNYVLRVLLCLSIITLILTVFSKVRILSSFCTCIGKHSLEIFLYHGLVMYLIASIDNIFVLSISSSVFIFLTLFVTVFLSIPLKRIHLFIQNIG